MPERERLRGREGGGRAGERRAGESGFDTAAS
jgi:hypothetical protein